MKKCKKTIRKILKNREYTPPILHLEFLNENDLDIAWQIIQAFEGSCVAFVCVLRNELNDREINIHTYGIMSKKEKKNIYKELSTLNEYEGYTVTFD